MNRPYTLPTGRQSDVDLNPDLAPPADASPLRTFLSSVSVSAVVVIACIGIAYLLAWSFDEQAAADDAVAATRCELQIAQAVSTEQRIGASRAVAAYHAGLREAAEREAYAKELTHRAAQGKRALLIADRSAP